MAFGGEKIEKRLANLCAGLRHAEGWKFENRSFDFTRCLARRVAGYRRKKARRCSTGGLALTLSVSISDGVPDDQPEDQLFGVR